MHVYADVFCHACVRRSSVTQPAAAALLQIVETQLGKSPRHEVSASAEMAEVAVADVALHISCGGGGVLKVPTTCCSLDHIISQDCDLPSGPVRVFPLGF